MLIDRALDAALWDISPSHGPAMSSDDFEEELSLWGANYPLAAETFPPTLAHVTVIDMQTKLAAPEEWVPTDYHWLLLYAALETTIVYLNDGEAPEFLAEMKAAKSESDFFLETEKVELEEFVEAFFWDTDFLIDATDVANLTAQGKELLRLSPEVFGLSHGMQPHPEELVMRRWDEDDERTPS